MKGLILKASLWGGLVGATLTCNAQQTFGKLIDYQLAKPWNESAWISAKDAQVVTGKVHDGTRAADGASWFVSNPRNAKKVKQAIWQTSALGTYDLYINGQLVGDEVLKPGFTHMRRPSTALLTISRRLSSAVRDRRTNWLCRWFRAGGLTRLSPRAVTMV
jgi:hypothetical protein